MNQPKIFNGVACERLVSYQVPEEIMNSLPKGVNTPIVPMLDLRTLVKYPDNNIGEYYASRHDLARMFYEAAREMSYALKGAEPSYMVPYKEEGWVEFVFETFVLSHDQNVIYALYEYNTTIS